MTVSCGSSNIWWVSERTAASAVIALTGVFSEGSNVFIHKSIIINNNNNK